jgi:hypothetical protein
VMVAKLPLKPTKTVNGILRSLTANFKLVLLGLNR